MLYVVKRNIYSLVQKYAQEQDISDLLNVFFFHSFFVVSGACKLH